MKKLFFSPHLALLLILALILPPSYAPSRVSLSPSMVSLSNHHPELSRRTLRPSNAGMEESDVRGQIKDALDPAAGVEEAAEQALIATLTDISSGDLLTQINNAQRVDQTARTIANNLPLLPGLDAAGVTRPAVVPVIANYLLGNLSAHVNPEFWPEAQISFSLRQENSGTSTGNFLLVEYRDQSTNSLEIPLDQAVRIIGASRNAPRGSTSGNGAGLTLIYNLAVEHPGGSFTVEALDVGGQRKRLLYNRPDGDPVPQEPSEKQGTILLAKFPIPTLSVPLSYLAGHMRKQLSAGVEETKEILRQGLGAATDRLTDEDVRSIRRTDSKQIATTLRLYSRAFADSQWIPSEVPDRVLLEMANRLISRRLLYSAPPPLVRKIASSAMDVISEADYLTRKLPGIETEIRSYIAAADPDDPWGEAFRGLLQEEDQAQGRADWAGTVDFAVQKAVEAFYPDLDDVGAAGKIVWFRDRVKTAGIRELLRELSGARASFSPLGNSLYGRLFYEALMARLLHTHFKVDFSLPGSGDSQTWFVVSEDPKGSSAELAGKVTHEVVHQMLEETGGAQRFGTGGVSPADWVTQAAEELMGRALAAHRGESTEPTGAPAAFGPTVRAWLHRSGRRIARTPTSAWTPKIIQNYMNLFPSEWVHYAVGHLVAGIGEELGEEAARVKTEENPYSLSLSFVLNDFAQASKGRVHLNELGEAAKKFRARHGLPEEYTAGVEEGKLKLNEEQGKTAAERLSARGDDAWIGADPRRTQSRGRLQGPAEKSPDRQGSRHFSSGNIQILHQNNTTRPIPAAGLTAQGTGLTNSPVTSVAGNKSLKTSMTDRATNSRLLPERKALPMQQIINQNISEINNYPAAGGSTKLTTGPSAELRTGLEEGEGPEILSEEKIGPPRFGLTREEWAGLVYLFENDPKKVPIEWQEVIGELRAMKTGNEDAASSELGDPSRELIGTLSRNIQRHALGTRLWITRIMAGYGIAGFLLAGAIILHESAKIPLPAGRPILDPNLAQGGPFQEESLFDEVVGTQPILFQGGVAVVEGWSVEWSSLSKFQQRLTADQKTRFFGEKTETWMIPVSAQTKLRRVRLMDQAGIPAGALPRNVNRIDWTGKKPGEALTALLELDPPLQEGEPLFLDAGQVTPEGVRHLLPEGARARVVLVSPARLRQAVSEREITALVQSTVPGQVRLADDFTLVRYQGRLYLLVSA